MSSNSLYSGKKWADDVTLSNIHERSMFTWLFSFIKNTKLSMETP